MGICFKQIQCCFECLCHLIQTMAICFALHLWLSIFFQPWLAKSPAVTLKWKGLYFHAYDADDADDAAIQL